MPNAIQNRNKPDLSATLEQPPNGWRSIGPYLRPNNKETANLIKSNVPADDLDEQGRINYGGIFFSDIYLHLSKLSSGLGISIIIDDRITTAEELYEASA
jgi:hypothetical protein